MIFSGFPKIRCLFQMVTFNARFHLDRTMAAVAAGEDDEG